jgi:TonB-linked SusC/RagA family outer membrane protein
LLPVGLATAQETPAPSTSNVARLGPDAVLATMAPRARHPLVATGIIRGVVTQTEAKTPVERATITVSGTTLATTTGIDGRFTIPGVAAGTHWVVARRLGFAADSVSVVVRDGETVTADLTLVSVATRLAAVVTTGYGTQSRREVTGSIATITGEDIRQVVGANPLDAVKGRIPGVDITASSFEPGAANAIRIRGTRSISASNNPLYVVDDVPITGDLRDIDPTSIEHIDVLKDAAATAVYGSRGANGVVMITTKRGRAGINEVTVSSTYGMSTIRREVPMMNAQEFANFRRESYRAGGSAAARTACANYMTDPAPCDQFALDSKMRANLAAGVDTDWQDELLRTGRLQNTQLGFSGGNADTRFRAGFGYLNQTGIATTQDYNSPSASFNIAHINKRLSLQLGIQGAKSRRNVGLGALMWDEALFNPPLGRVRDSTGALDFLPTEDGLLVNPVSNAHGFTRRIERTNVLGTLTGSFELMNGLRIHSNFGPQYTTNEDGQLVGVFTRAKRGQGAPDATLRRTSNTNYTFSNFLDFDRTYGGSHHVQATALYEIASFRTVFDSAAALALPFDNQLWYSLGTGSTPTLNGTFTRTMLQSGMGRAIYTFLDRYTLSVTGRYDGSSVLAPGHKFAFFPAASLGWQIGDESFMRSVPAISDLKLRVSYGRVGNSAIGAYQTLGLLGRTWYANNNSYLVGFQPGAIPNPDLRWETTDKYNIGVDFGVLGQRIAGSVDAYRENTHDLLLPRALPYTSGYSTITQNVGATKNLGLEFSLSTQNLQGWHGVDWTTDFNISTNKNRIVSLQSGLKADVGSLRWVGEPINVYYDYRYLGIWQTADSALARTSCGCAPGQIRVQDLNGDGRINSDDRTIIGRHYNNPRWQGSLNNRFRVGPVDLSVLATARYGFLINDSFTAAYNQLAGRFSNIRTNYWTPENQSAPEPRPSTNGLGNFAGARNYKDGSFVRVRDITLGYRVPTKWASRMSATSLRLYARAQDPFIFTDYKGWDPEAGFNAGNGNSQQSQADVGGPAFRTLLFGFDIGF